MTPEQLKIIGRLTSLENLSLNTNRLSKISDDEMASFVAKLPHLSQLQLLNFKLTGEFLQSIVNSDKLVKIVLTTLRSHVSMADSTSQISAQTLVSLKRFSNLGHLDLSGKTHTREHYKAIASLKNDQSGVPRL